ncbi:MAG: sigma-70 family RNA polymerase sigma factor, partial [Candidatus Poribacteria bacterium]|nr:sigma-70 family RNA polymerase sigma factor [Candidatus Poribacteria bacterium]
NSLSLKHRTVVVLYEFEGLTHVEIASILGCSEGTVRSRLHYARKQLRDRLKSYIDTTSVDLR